MFTFVLLYLITNILPVSLAAPKNKLHDTTKQEEALVTVGATDTLKNIL